MSSAAVGRRSLWKVVLQDHGALLALVLLAAFTATQSEAFLTWANVLNILRQAAPVGIIALGMTLVIIMGGIDLSVGAVCALVGGAAVLTMNAVFSGTENATLAILAAVGVCGLAGPALGLLNGVLITKGKLAPFIATLGAMAIWRSVAITAADAGNFSVASLKPLSDSFRALSSSGIPLPFLPERVQVWWPIVAFGVLAVVLHVVLRRTRYGKYVVAVGSNERAAEYSGINVARVKLITYALVGLTCGVAALFLAARLNSINSGQAGVLYELDAIAAVVIGGTLMTGGRGSIYGTVVGVLLLAVVSNMLNMFQEFTVFGQTVKISTYAQGLVKGLIIIAAVLLQRGRK
jgi:ribose transport system permease protein